jgi:hypothetical protein
VHKTFLKSYYEDIKEELLEVRTAITKVIKGIVVNLIWKWPLCEALESIQNIGISKFRLLTFRGFLQAALGRFNCFPIFKKVYLWYMEKRFVTYMSQTLKETTDHN